MYAHTLSLTSTREQNVATFHLKKTDTFQFQKKKKTGIDEKLASLSFLSLFNLWFFCLFLVYLYFKLLAYSLEANSINFIPE